MGDTALAFYIGHRKSVDIDLFSNFTFDASQLIELIQQDYPLQLFNTYDFCKRPAFQRFY